jgi:hypothetical protein
MAIEVYLEIGAKHCFAAAVEFPGWARRGKGDDGALEELDNYRERYRAVAERAGIKVPKTDLAVVERLPERKGDTDFGVLGATPQVDTRPTTSAAAHRIAALVQAVWDELDEIRATATEELRKGPRGGGRDREKMFAHVIGAEASYGRMIGVRHKQPDNDDTAAITAMRADLLTALNRPSDGTPLRDNGWTQRYAARRIAWHALDHAWEMQDKTLG